MSSTIQRDLERRLKDSEFAVEYGENIAKAEVAITVAQVRRSCGLTQDDLAKMLGTSQSYIAKLEGGDANPTVGNVGRILARLGLRLSMGVSPLSSSLETKTGWYRALDSNNYIVTWSSGFVTNEPGASVSSLWPVASSYSYAYYGTRAASSIRLESQADVVFELGSPRENERENIIQIKETA